MEDRQLCGHPQARQEILLTLQIVLANLTPIMFRQAARIHHRKVTSTRCTNVWSYTPLTDGSAGGEFCNRCPPLIN